MIHHSLLELPNLIRVSRPSEKTAGGDRIRESCAVLMSALPVALVTQTLIQSYSHCVADADPPLAHDDHEVETGVITKNGSFDVLSADRGFISYDDARSWLPC